MRARAALVASMQTIEKSSLSRQMSSPKIKNFLTRISPISSGYQTLSLECDLIYEMPNSGYDSSYPAFGIPALCQLGRGHWSWCWGYCSVVIWATFPSRTASIMSSGMNPGPTSFPQCASWHRRARDWSLRIEIICPRSARSNIGYAPSSTFHEIALKHIYSYSVEVPFSVSHKQVDGGTIDCRDWRSFEWPQENTSSAPSAFSPITQHPYRKPHLDKMPFPEELSPRSETEVYEGQAVYHVVEIARFSVSTKSRIMRHLTERKTSKQWSNLQTIDHRLLGNLQNELEGRIIL